ncbi:hypothetical protein Aglo03_28170 [Actinokineospora globicatena]|uniref:DUF397 domain-containing protein n=1 Tax=Actinokineospora globicatena TaxID=103729 RepID=A0A9W6VAE0_9PSEU|nr:hypothetical protein Aglo03_28170 [Actinokineospora globicatena]
MPPPKKDPSDEPVLPRKTGAAQLRGVASGGIRTVCTRDSPRDCGSALQFDRTQWQEFLKTM